MDLDLLSTEGARWSNCVRIRSCLGQRRENDRIGQTPVVAQPMGPPFSDSSHTASRNEFHEAGPDATRWVAHNEFRFSGFMKVIGLLMRPVFPKQCYKFMEAFKAFAEAQPK